MVADGPPRRAVGRENGDPNGESGDVNQSSDCRGQDELSNVFLLLEVWPGEGSSGEPDGVHGPQEGQKGAQTDVEVLPTQVQFVRIADF